MRGSKRRCLLVIASCLILAQPLMAQGPTGNLVDVKWVEKNLANDSVLILDASPAPMYAAGHIPGAVAVDVFSYGAQEKPLAEMERMYQSWGVSSGQTIVLYDQGGTYLATRAFFALYYHGVPAKNLLILDGGLSKWQAAGLPVTKDVIAPKPGSFKAKAGNEEVRARLPEFLNAAADPAANVLLEALGPDWHFGSLCPFGRPGHPPFGVMLPAPDMFNPDKTFKSPEELRRMLAYLSIKPDQTVYTYCGGGIAASVPFFALRFILGYPSVKLFVESELGYMSDERELPLWTYDAPFLMRETKWLQGWGGQMVRTYVGTKVSIVDVRPADAFAEGHVPYAVNIPVEVFRDNLGNPAKLAGLIGAAGVNASHEAVIVSGAGLTKEAALAFVALEKLGQKRLSVLMDSPAQWTQQGFSTKVPTIVGPPKTPKDFAVPPATYAAPVREDVIVSDPSSTKGLYPKVFIASGATLPRQSVEGKVVHVPYSELLNADGTPKAAKDIWSTLSKAGVPRYAELVCFSDEPAEAAVNYFILKLMGYPDITVWGS
jgi:3-mercaptopyruvate sulfurtransferase SseA